MITVTSAEKNKIEGQMKTALPFINNQVDFEMGIEDGRKGRSILTFKQDGEVYKLPIFYITPSTDDSAWEVLTDHIEEETGIDGVFFVKFNTSLHVINQAVTYALTNHDLYQKNMLSEISRLCSYVDLKSYQIQLFELTDVCKLFDKLNNQDEIEMPAVKTVVTVEETKEQPETEVKKEVKEDPAAAVKEEVKAASVKVEEKAVRAEAKPVKVEAKPIKEEVKPVNIEPKVKPLSAEEDQQLDSDIRALINDCFGIF